MKLFISLLLCTCFFLVACNAAKVKPDEVAMASAAQKIEGATQQVSNPATQSPSDKQPNKSIDKFELIENRMTAVQDHLLQIKSQAGQLQQQNQALSLQLESLKTDLQGVLAEQSSEVSEEQAPTPDAFNGVLDQITMMANELGSQVQDGSFRITSAYTAKGQWVLIRFHRYTGESWLADKGQWIRLEESSASGTAEYEVILLRADKDVKGYVAARINRITGETWWLKQDMWQPYVSN